MKWQKYIKSAAESLCAVVGEKSLIANDAQGQGEKENQSFFDVSDFIKRHSQPESAVNRGCLR